jgi:hypothetical protein
MVAAQVVIQTGGALHRASGALVERDVLGKQADSDQAVELAFGRFEASDVSDELYAQVFQRLAKPLIRGEIAAQPAWNEQASHEATSRQARAWPLRPLLKQLALGFADLERRRIAPQRRLLGSAHALRSIFPSRDA